MDKRKKTKKMDKRKKFFFLESKTKRMDKRM